MNIYWMRIAYECRRCSGTFVASTEFSLNRGFRTRTCSDVWTCRQRSGTPFSISSIFNAHRINSKLVVLHSRVVVVVKESNTCSTNVSRLVFGAIASEKIELQNVLPNKSWSFNLYVSRMHPARITKVKRTEPSQQEKWLEFLHFFAASDSDCHLSWMIHWKRCVAFYSVFACKSTRHLIKGRVLSSHDAN